MTIKDILRIGWYVLQGCAIYYLINLVAGPDGLYPYQYPELVRPGAILLGYLVFMINLYLAYGRPRRYVDEWEQKNIRSDDKQ